MRLAELLNKRISDIIKIGFTTLENGYAHMSFLDRYLFIELDSVILKLTSVDQYSQLEFEITPEITFDIELDDDLTPGKASVATIILTDNMADNRIDTIELFYCGDKTDSKTTCHAISIYLACGQEIFIDPTYYFGLNIGGKEQKEKWLLNLPNGAENVTSEVINLIF